MPAAERVVLEAIVRPVIGMYLTRAGEVEHLRPSAQSMTRVVVEVLRRGCAASRGTGATYESHLLSPVHLWLQDVANLLNQLDKEIHPSASNVLLQRFWRSSKWPKQEMASFGRIAVDITAECEREQRAGAVTLAEAEAICIAAIRRMAQLLVDADIGPDLRFSEPRVCRDVEMADATRSRLIEIGLRLRRFAQKVTHTQRDWSRSRGECRVIDAATATEMYRDAAHRQGRDERVVPRANLA